MEFQLDKERDGVKTKRSELGGGSTLDGVKEQVGPGCSMRS